MQQKLDIMGAVFGGDRRREIALALAIAGEQRLHCRAGLRQGLAPQQSFRVARTLQPRHGFRQCTLDGEPCRIEALLRGAELRGRFALLRGLAAPWHRNVKTDGRGDADRLVVGLDKRPGADGEIGIPGFVGERLPCARGVDFRAARRQSRVGGARALHKQVQVRVGDAADRQTHWLRERGINRPGDERVEARADGAPFALETRDLDLRRRLFAERLNDVGLAATTLTITGTRRGVHAARHGGDVPVDPNLAADRVILGEGDLDPLVALIPRALLAAARGRHVSQCRLPAQIALTPKRKGLRDRDRNPAKDARAPVILVTGVQHRIVEGVRALGLCRWRPRYREPRRAGRG